MGSHLITKGKNDNSRKVLAELRKLGFSLTSEAVNWNDTNGRTKEEVIKRLEDAAFGREVK